MSSKVEIRKRRGGHRYSGSVGENVYVPGDYGVYVDGELVGTIGSLEREIGWGGISWEVCELVNGAPRPIRTFWSYKPGPRFEMAKAFARSYFSGAIEHRGKRFGS